MVWDLEECWTMKTCATEMRIQSGLPLGLYNVECLVEESWLSSSMTALQSTVSVLLQIRCVKDQPNKHPEIGDLRNGSGVKSKFSCKGPKFSPQLLQEFQWLKPSWGNTEVRAHTHRGAGVCASEHWFSEGIMVALPAVLVKVHSMIFKSAVTGS